MKENANYNLMPLWIVNQFLLNVEISQQNNIALVFRKWFSKLQIHGIVIMALMCMARCSYLLCKKINVLYFDPYDVLVQCIRSDSFPTELHIIW